ncbi:MAG: hypothetical protein KJS91_07330, partial [Planctomycetes bacterium]|nr:hypothetical protein [Planctomycetota bacterium]
MAGVDEPGEWPSRQTDESTRSFDPASPDWESDGQDIPTHTRSEGDSRAPDAASEDSPGGWESDLRDRLRLTGFSEPRSLIEPLPGRRVYLCRHLDLDRNVAVKVFLPVPGARRPWLEAFKREARAAAKVDHPLVLRLHAGGQLEGCAYLVYDYCEGG